MSTMTMDLGGNEAVATRKVSSRSVLHIVLAVSILCGPLAYLICRAINAGFAGESQGLAVIALFVTGFELVWLGYGAIAILAKAFRV